MDEFMQWYVTWIRDRGNDAPIGWYMLADLEAAFNAGMAAMDARTAELIEHALREQDTQEG